MSKDFSLSLADKITGGSSSGSSTLWQTLYIMDDHQKGQGCVPECARIEKVKRNFHHVLNPLQWYGSSSTVCSPTTHYGRQRWVKVHHEPNQLQWYGSCSIIYSLQWYGSRFTTHSPPTVMWLKLHHEIAHCNDMGHGPPRTHPLQRCGSTFMSVITQKI